MSLIGRRKKSKTVFQQVLGSVRILLKALVAQRIARSAYKGYKWTRRLPYLVGGGVVIALVAVVARKALQRARTPSDSGFTPPTPASPAPAAPTVPSTPTPTGSPTAVTPAPTAAPDGAPDAGDGKDAAPES